MKLRKTKCSKHLDDDLLELQRRREKELLRPHLIAEKCFPLHKNPATSPITKDALKKLARAWKMQVWKLQLSTNDMIAELIRFLNENGHSVKKIAKSEDDEDDRSYSPQPPSAPRPHRSITSSPSWRTRHFVEEAFRDFYKSHKDDKYSLANPDEMVLNSRFIQPEISAAVSVLDPWVDPSLGRDAPSFHAKVKRIAQVEDVVSKSKTEKHRAISRHLVLFSADVSQKNITRQSLDAVFRLADTDDKLTLLNCAITIANMCTRPQLRASLIEMNVLGKTLHFAHNLSSKTAVRSICLTVYHLSLIDGAQDVIFNSCQGILKTYCSSQDSSISNVALQAMNNLLLCNERINLVHMLMSVFQGEEGKIMQYNIRTGSRETATATSRQDFHHMLAALFNVSTFLNCHKILFEHGVFDMVDRIINGFLKAVKAQEFFEPADRDLPRYSSDSLMVATMMNHFAHTPDSLARVKNSDYVFARIFLNLLNLGDNPVALAETIHAVAVLSGFPNLTRCVATADLCRVIFGFVNSTGSGGVVVTPDMAADVAVIVCNVSHVGLMDPEVLCNQGALDAIVSLLRHGPPSCHPACCIGLLNLLTEEKNCVENVDVVMQPISDFISRTGSLDAIHCLYNICCSRECISGIVAAKGHLWLQGYVTRPECTLEAKIATLQVIVQLAREQICVQDLLANGGIGLMVDLVNMNERAIFLDIIKFVLCALLHDSPLSPTELESVVYILNKICSGRLSEFANDEQVLSKCAIVLGFLSVKECDFLSLERVLRLTLKVAHTDLVLESISTALYNIISSRKNIEVLLQDEFYLNMMVRMMRSGSISVQEKIAQVMRNLCADPKCAEILLQKENSQNNDLVADFVVIALLRTNSAEIKIITCQAVFNMLCHNNFRDKFIDANIWWATVKFSKSDIGEIHTIATNTLFYLSTYPKYDRVILSAGLFGFVKDMMSSAHGAYLLACLKALQNVIGRTSGSLMVRDVVALIGVCHDALFKSDSVETSRCTLQLLRQAGDICSTGQDLQEFVQVEILLSLERTQAVWIDDGRCRLHVSHLLAKLSRFGVFCNMVPLAEVEVVLALILRREAEKLRTLGHDLSHNCMSAILSYTERSLGDVSEILALGSWRCLVDNLFHPDTEDKDLPLSTRLSALTVFALCLHRSPNTSSEAIRPWTILRILLSDLPMADPPTAANTMFLICHFTHSEALASVLISDAAEFFRFLNSLLIRAHKIDSVISVYEFCSTVLRNLSFHPRIVEKLVNSKGLDVLYRNILASPLPSIFLDIAITLKHIITVTLRDTDVISPRFVLLQVTSILDTVKDPLVTTITKKVLTKVLDEYSKDMGYDVRYIQSLLTDLNEEGDNDEEGEGSEDGDDGGKGRDQEVKFEPKLLPILLPVCSPVPLLPPVKMESYKLPDGAWTFMVAYGKSTGMVADVPFPGGTEPISSVEMSVATPRHLQPYSKIEKSFPVIVFDSAEEASPEDLVGASLEDDSIPASSPAKKSITFQV